MRSGSIEHFDQSFIVGNTIYDFAAQVSYHDNLNLDITDLTKNHFYSRVKINGEYFKFDGKFCTKKTKWIDWTGISNAMTRILSKTKLNRICRQRDSEKLRKRRNIWCRSFKIHWTSREWPFHSLNRLSRKTEWRKVPELC